MKPVIRTISVVFLAVLLASCAKSNHPQDPLEGLNREIYGFNRAVDKGVLRPVAYFYYAYTPKPFQTSVHNFFNNLGTLPTIANDLLQFKFGYAAHDISRFLINSTIGLGGLYDPANHLGLVSRTEDFGQTLYTWGYRDSIYIVLPLLGPSTVRDTIGMAVDTAFSVWPYVDEDSIRYSAKALELIDMRASLLRNETVLESVGVDEYAFVRDAYLQRREYFSYDGQVPIEFQDVDPFEDEDWLDDDEALEDDDYFSDDEYFEDDLT